MTMRLKRSLATLLAFAIYLQPIAQNTFAIAAAPTGTWNLEPGTDPGTMEPVTAGTKPLEPVAPLEPLEPLGSSVGVVEQSGQAVVYGPNTYVRTSGPPNIYNVSFPLPAGISGPFTMHVVNGSANGTNRLSSSVITLNGVEVASAGDFGQQVSGFDKTVSLQAQNAIEYRVTSVQDEIRKYLLQFAGVTKSFRSFMIVGANDLNLVST